MRVAIFFCTACLTTGISLWMFCLAAEYFR